MSARKLYTDMPNLASIYTSLTHAKREEDLPPINEEDAAKRQSLNNWRNATITKEKVSELMVQINDLLNESIKLAVTYPQYPQNAAKIIHNLVKVETLKNLMDDYAGH